MNAMRDTGRGFNLLVGAVLAGALLVLQGCASSNDLQKALNPDPPGVMYAAADSLMTKGKYEAAAQKFEDLDRDHPYAPEARRAIVMSAYAYYKAGKLPEAIASAQRYTTMHPGTKEAAFAHHIIASSYFDEMRTPNRDQSSTRKALKELKKLKASIPTASTPRRLITVSVSLKTRWQRRKCRLAVTIRSAQTMLPRSIASRRWRRNTRQPRMSKRH